MLQEFLEESLFFGAVISLLCYMVALRFKEKTRFHNANALLLAMIMIIAILLLFDIDYEIYFNGAQYLQYFLTPVTVSLTIPLYRQMTYLKKYPAAILIGVASGVLTAMISIYVMSMLFGLTHEQYVSLLPKSITTAVALGITDKLNGISGLTVIAISITGLLGNAIAESACHLFRIKNPVARGLAIGTSAHLTGTIKAVELGEIEGALSSLSVVIASLMTVIAASFCGTLL